MEDPAKTEVEDKEFQVINSGSEKGCNELSQLGASLDIASGETPETEGTVLLKEGENEESLEYSHETKSGKKKKKRKKKKAEMTNVAPDNTEQPFSTSTSNVEETNAKVDSASKGRTSGKECCLKLDPAVDSRANKKKKKKKKKKKAESEVCGTLENQIDNQDFGSIPKEEKSVEDQSDLAVVKNENQENDAGTKSQKECGDAVSSSFGNESEHLSENSPAETTAARAEERNVPTPEKGDGSSAEIVPDVVKPEIAQEKQLENQDLGSASEEEKSVEHQSGLAVAKNENQENDADTKSEEECSDAVSGGIGNDSENLSDGSSAVSAAARAEDGNSAAPEKEDGSSSEMVSDVVKPVLATISDGAKESGSDTDVPEEEGMESDSADNLSDEPDNEGRNILCIFKLIYGVGLRALRKLFMEINPAWSNQPSDAAGFDKWKMRLRKDQEVIFNNGNINEWDFSLMTTTLLHSKSCALEISKRPGYNTALQELMKHRNNLVGHPSTEVMSDADFNHVWPLLKNSFIALGAHPDDIAEIKLQSDKDLHAGGYYKQLFLTEQANRLPFGTKLESMENKLDVITEMIANKSSDYTNKSPVSPKDLSGPNWDEWLRFSDAVGDFDTRKNQYILVTDALSPDNQERFSILRRVAWKMVLDFDPMSEEKGFYHSFTSQEGQGSLISMITPAEVKGSTIVGLARQIDPNKIQWVFVNGRSSDTAGKLPTFSDWEATSVKEISRFFGCCCDPDKFDKQKAVVCLILPLRQESSPFLEITLSRLFENFDDQFNLKTVSFKQQKPLSVFGKVKVRTIDLSPELVHLGLKGMLTSSSFQRYRMPTSQAKVPVDLSEKEYLYLREHLEILYDGCEELPEVSSDPSEEDAQLKNFFNEHRRLFMSGHEISFASLYDNHDAKREIEKDIQIHVQRLLDNGLTRSMMVEIKHSPGTGGTTIARRVMWDLHKAYPCAFIEIGSHLYFDEDNSYASKLADRIAALEEICHTSPVVLIDGKQSRVIDGLSNKLVRMLGNRGKRALLLRCQHGSKTSSKESQESSRVHQVFYVEVKLEDSVADLNEFHSKYKEFIERSLGETPVAGACRVFHFPLLAMMQTFRPKLKKIIDDTWNEMKTLQQEIAVMVAFLQMYANQSTPALLIYDAFKRYIRLEDGKNVTYEDIKQLFSEHLLNLMVPTNPLQRRGRMYQLKESSPQQYTFQHRLVAEMLLKKCCQEQGCDLFQVVNQFLQYPISRRDDFLLLFEELFVYNKDGLRKRKFSFMFEELKAIDQERAAQVFREAAVKTGDSIIFASAARFFAKMEPPSFPKAMELIEQAFQAPNTKQRFRSVCHTKGVVLYIELQHMINNGKVKDLKRLEELASRVLEAYNEARNFPPTYPSPLIGEVDVWLACIGWIMKNKCGRDSERTLKFLANQCPPFFRTCVSDSFYLLDIVDRIVQSVPSLPDPEETQRKCNDTRLSLMKTFGTGPSSKGRGRDAEDVVQACQALCSAKNFPKSSALELKRLQAQFIFYSSEQIDSLKQEHLEFLLKLLEELVLKENEHRLAYHLMKVCVLVTGKKRYSLEQGLIVCDKWSDFSYHDCLPYFYQMAICFLKILDGNAMEFTPKYLRALKLCREKSQNHCRSSQSTLFVSKEGEGMSRLLTRSTLFRGESDYSTEVSEKVTKFWLVDSRKKLLECRGRIRLGPSSNRGKTYPYIELLQGKVDLYVGKNADIGKVDRDFTIGQLVYFVVSFNLQGPVANGITFSPHNATPH